MESTQEQVNGASADIIAVLPEQLLAPSPPAPKKLEETEVLRLQNLGLRGDNLRHRIREIEAMHASAVQQAQALSTETDTYVKQLSEKYGVVLRPGMVAEDGTINVAPLTAAARMGLAAVKGG